jgi:hypothetical protein
MPWRRKPEPWLRYWSDGTPTTAKATGLKTILVYCVGPPRGFGRLPCHHTARLSLDELPEWDWYEISAHLRCTKCDSVGFVDTRRDLSEIINFNKGVCS